MIISKAQIASDANVLLGNEPIQDIETDDPDTEVMAALIDFTFDALLSETNWRFAIKDEVLSILVDAPNDPRYNYQGEIPINADQIINVYNSGGSEVDWLTSGDGTIILTNTKNCRIKYKYKPVIYNFPSYFRSAFVYQLAANACEGNSGDNTLASRLETKASKALKSAIISDGKGDSPSKIFKPSHVVSGRR